MIASILDTDLYKLTMQQAVLEHYPDAVVSYRFTNRGGDQFTREAYERVRSEIAALSSLRLQPAERAFLERKCAYFTPAYLDELQRFRFRPHEQVQLEFVPERVEDGHTWGHYELSVTGKWMETILYEVPLMAIVSECYFTLDRTSWDYVGQYQQAREKGLELFMHGCLVSEFGTRRRRSYLAQDIVLRGLIQASGEAGKLGGKGKLSGTSNVHFAMKYDLAPIGTIAHEFIMAVAALEGYEGSNGRAMDLWDITYPTRVLSIALTDTFSTGPFFKDFVSNRERALHWKGVRQDSGDAFKFIELAKTAFVQVGSVLKEKIIVFSDGLDLETCLKLKDATVAAGMLPSFGVGTFLTNDFKVVESPVEQTTPGEGVITPASDKSKALNMVIKLRTINGIECVKISDELTKNTGDPAAVRNVKSIFHLC